MTRIANFLLLAAFSQWVFATDFYVSNNGSDNNSGTSPDNPWATIDKISSIGVYQAGNRFLFERGGSYSGTLGNEGWANTYIGAYGEGNNPVFDGTKQVTGTWANTGNNIGLLTLRQKPTTAAN
ncbi:MAG: hypothetical protein HC896_03390 [Bacteroidales bacterium]|nr:hypothetical protein [Bacteroidales bacterium]